MLEIIRIHNELLGTYGDRGNADVLAFRAKLAGVKTRITDIAYPDELPSDGDIYLLGGAEDAAQALSLEAMKKKLALNKAVKKGAVVLAICAGFQIVGTTYVSRDEKIAGLGLLDVDTEPGNRRLVGDISVQTDFITPALTGFENHGGVTTLGSDAQPFGRVLVGNGNGVAGVDGAVAGNVFGTYLHGPVLARNPEFADLLLERATGTTLTVVNDELADRYAKWRRDVTK
jgi:lipid II isoglutaminyl synthase (glutamine-hydrolysing)